MALGLNVGRRVRGLHQHAAGREGRGVAAAGDGGARQGAQGAWASEGAREGPQESAGRHCELWLEVVLGDAMGGWSDDEG